MHETVMEVMVNVLGGGKSQVLLRFCGALHARLCDTAVLLIEFMWISSGFSTFILRMLQNKFPLVVNE